MASWTSGAGLLGVEDGGRRLGDRGEDRHVVELLQRPGAPAQLRRPSAEHDQRRAVEPRRGHRRDPVGDARSGGQRGHGRAAGQLGVGLGGERRRLLVAGVEHPHALVAARLVQRPDVPTVEGEHDVDPEGPHRRHRLLAGVALDPLRSCAHGATPLTPADPSRNATVTGRSLNALCRWSTGSPRRSAATVSTGGRKRCSWWPSTSCTRGSGTASGPTRSTRAPSRSTPSTTRSG